MTTTDTLCRECRGTGERAYQTNHPMCGRCYGTGIEGMTIGRLEDEARVAREAAEFEFPEADPAESDPAEAELTLDDWNQARVDAGLTPHTAERRAELGARFFDRGVPSSPECPLHGADCEAWS